MTNCANGTGYAASLVVLGPPPTVGGQPFISPDLGVAAPVTKSGYSIAYTVSNNIANATCTGAATVQANYLSTAAPTAMGTTGTRYFGSSEAQTIFQHTAAITAINTSGTPTPNAALPIK